VRFNNNNNDNNNNNALVIDQFNRINWAFINVQAELHKCQL